MRIIELFVKFNYCIFTLSYFLLAGRENETTKSFHFEEEFIQTSEEKRMSIYKPPLFGMGCGILDVINEELHKANLHPVFN